MSTPITPQELEQIEGDLREGYLTAFDMLNEVVDPDSELGRRFYAWLEKNEVYSDIDFIWKFGQLLKQAQEDWQSKTN